MVSFPILSRKQSKHLKHSYLYTYPPCLQSKKAAAPHPHSHSSSSSQIPQSTTTTHPQIAQDSQADYKGKLCLVIGRDAKNISPENALSYVAACTSRQRYLSTQTASRSGSRGPCPAMEFL
ncbi:hypothetical protein ACN42_g320 [Penicillium freii]|uniref:Fumarylacetoacetase-like C-terminal domain-containing protein n=1 Tax=Penicillium freii TaxID=48697 RepID=A0A117NSV9_PENFR|nr:hypothetical protein ACN42_g320 [Penicillium freii]